jgi:ABC-2 type transport system permease protein
VSRSIAAELLKLRTTRTFWGLVVTTVVLVLVVTGLTLAFDDTAYRTEGDVRSVLSSGGISGLLLLILGVVFGAGEYRHGTIASTLLVTPDRLRVVSGQALGCAVAGVVIGLVASVLVLALGVPWLAAKDAPELSAGALAGMVGGGVLYAALAGAFGAALGALLRNQVAAVVLVLVLLFVVDPALGALFADDYVPYSLNGLGLAMSGAPGDELESDLLAVWAAALVWTGYTLVLVAAAALLTSRRDI